MFNINKLMEKDYRPATIPNTNSSYKLKLLVVTSKVLVVLIHDLFLWFVNLFKSSEPENISKKLALVTGGANGLGRSLCFRLAQEGCDIAVVDIDYKAACQTAAEIQEKYKNICKPYRCDVSDKAAIYKLKNDIEKEIRGVDILVNNAGLLYTTNFLTSDVEDIERTVNVNLLSQILMTRIFITGMIERKYGRIMSICSISGIVAGPTMATYSATKKGADGFMRALKEDILVSGNDDFIKLSLVYPDFILTRQELSNILDAINHFLPRVTPDRVADDTVNGLKSGKEFIFATDIMPIYYAAKYLTKNAKKYIATSVLNTSIIFKKQL
ncbi:estradiol 17-beta-dehydrogenase 11-like [Chironomus tepperi]|uniref:estradiol 17-beta-dehydrogenase 11-like n=1 Tax=Chironomus tepperi TaxID=113505 RepID=UPI00391F98BF